MYVPLEENARISIQNVLNGRPFDEGWLKPTHIPDPRYPEWIELKIEGE